MSIATFNRPASPASPSHAKRAQLGLLFGHDTVEVELDFAGDDAAEAFDEAAGFVVFLAEADDLVELHAGGNSVGGLVDDLIAGVELGDDEVTGGAVGEHAAGVGVVIGAGGGEAGEEAGGGGGGAGAGGIPARCW